ncbi:hypothetical protein M8542_35265 [Amycolatopsis sp. OK19-0408]|uniref:Nucleotidyltransferase domain-containing protein n=1 Tax=Amycolatopsis iheyensis TaxID=2945988 RepID=A0A9X2NNB7_9PSEU|nr:hypothetical protein [Amycolatopsis iheyensis]MCR6488100.1 hypothetical protein [Amycolatopsis iheyensis]
MTLARSTLANRVRAALEAAEAGSRASLRGSLARGTADDYSDIDVEWLVPAAAFPGCVDVVPVLSAVRPVAAVRFSPDFLHSPVQRLVFVRFEGVSVFWRLDLDIRTDAADDRPGPAAEGEWSRPASALANALGAVKAVARGRFEDARGLLDRGFTRIGSADRATGDWAADVGRLAAACARLEPGLAGFAAEVAASA